MSCILAREGRPPFVLRTENAQEYFQPSSAITRTRKRGLAIIYRMPRYKRYFAAFLRKYADEAFLVRDPSAWSHDDAARVGSDSRPSLSLPKEPAAGAEHHRHDMGSPQRSRPGVTYAGGTR